MGSGAGNAFPQAERGPPVVDQGGHRSKNKRSKHVIAPAVHIFRLEVSVVVVSAMSVSLFSWNHRDLSDGYFKVPSHAQDSPKLVLSRSKVKS